MPPALPPLPPDDAPVPPGAPDGPDRRGLGRSFTNVFTANISSSLADGIARVAAPLLATRLTDDPLLVAGIAAVAMLPWLFFAIPSGVLLDRIDRRHAMVIANGARTLLAVTLITLYATDTLTIWWLYVVIFAYGALETLYDGAIRAVVPAIVRRADLPRANSRIEAGELVVQNFLAVPLTSALFAVAVVIPLGIGALSYAVAGLLAFFLPAAAAGAHRAHQQRADGALPPVRTTFARQLTDGFRFIMSHPMLRPLWFLSILIALFFSAAIATDVLFVLDRLDVPEQWFGVFMLSGAVGGIVGAVVVSPLKVRFGAGPVMAAANFVGPVALVVMGFFPTVPVAVVCFAVSFGSTSVWNVLVMSLRQAAIPGHLLGRVHGTWRTLLWGTMPLGSLLGGLLARIDLTTPLLVAGGLTVAVALIGYRFLHGLPNPEDVAEHALPTR
ncbi:MFS transporter [Oerskovia turbata]|uniref:MFS transporter n=1 Tax=Oerskovia turbata TaxID=1713 RepID=A0A4Q1KRN8_9CELL|nr:MFS transporter [Oerskovia turbata]RXR25328.1 MFS transporter [Oerskovia turbata]RXR32731.1 MFS transporter [Oerskovia turbata]TGJ95592.1 MFS transporter [Actinotalea fermentans ATCC 43279 = JCM 9966 = DSM 3133]